MKKRIDDELVMSFSESSGKNTVMLGHVYSLISPVKCLMLFNVVDISGDSDSRHVSQSR